MAHLALVVDEDPDRRERFLANVRRLFAEFPGTSINEARHGPFACIWVVGPRAPVSVHRDADGFALLIGLFVFATWNDIAHGAIGRWVAGLVS